MAKKTGGAFVNDLDILGDINLDGEDNQNIDSSLDDTAVLPDNGTTSPAEDIVEETLKEAGEATIPGAESPVEEVKEEVKEESKEEIKDETKDDKGEEGEDLDKWLQDLLKNDLEVEEKVEEVKDAAQVSGDEDLIKLVDELQNLVAQKNLENEELKKQVEVSNNRYLSKFGEEEELSIYRPEIEKMTENPRLMALVKYFGTDNEKVKPKLIQIISDMMYDLTGEDIASMLDNKNKDSMSMLNTPTGGAPVEEPKPKEEPIMNYEDSVNNILGF